MYFYQHRQHIIIMHAIMTLCLNCVMFFIDVIYAYKKNGIILEMCIFTMITHFIQYKVIWQTVISQVD